MTRPVVILAALLAASSLCAPVLAAETLGPVYRLMAYGEFEQAAEQLEAVLAKAPDEAADLRAEATFLLGRALESLGDWDAALRHYRTVTDRYAASPCFADAGLALAKLQMRLWRPKEAVHTLEAAIAAGLAPEYDLQARLSLAELISAPGTGVEDLDHALDSFRALDDKAERPADVARLNYGLGFCYQRKGDWEKAQQHYRTVAETAPKSLWSVYARMQLIAYFALQGLREDAARVRRQLDRDGVRVSVVEQADPRPPNAAFGAVREQEQRAGNAGEIEIPGNAVFAHKGYKITADRYVFSSLDRALVGHDNVLLRYETDTARVEIHAASIRIDLRRRTAFFAGDVSFESASKAPGGAHSKIAELEDLIVDLDSGQILFGLPEPSD